MQGCRFWCCPAVNPFWRGEPDRRLQHAPREQQRTLQVETMSFRKRNVAVAQPGNAASNNATAEKAAVPGVRPSPLDGRLTTSTGTRSLDSLLAGHSGLVLGTSLLVEEGGTTDFGGSLLRYYAAEGIVQGHQVHVLGMHESWGRELPGLSDSAFNRTEDTKASEGKMKIAWRYERLGEFGAGARGGRSFSCT